MSNNLLDTKLAVWHCQRCGTTDRSSVHFENQYLHWYLDRFCEDCAHEEYIEVHGENEEDYDDEE
jgi:hypothetical protein